jgi:hypothetical protein
MDTHRFNTIFRIAVLKEEIESNLKRGLAKYQTLRPQIPKSGEGRGVGTSARHILTIGINPIRKTPSSTIPTSEELSYKQGR